MGLKFGSAYVSPLLANLSQLGLELKIFRQGGVGTDWTKCKVRVGSASLGCSSCQLELIWAWQQVLLYFVSIPANYCMIESRQTRLNSWSRVSISIHGEQRTLNPIFCTGKPDWSRSWSEECGVNGDLRIILHRKDLNVSNSVSDICRIFKMLEELLMAEHLV